MTTPLRAGVSAAAATLAGLVALASGMGIGRFAFTPMLPLMQQASGLSLQAGGWLASANYAGYLAGAIALTAWSPAPGKAARAGLVAVAAFTLAMGFTERLSIALALRFAAGLASAAVLIGISGAVLPVLAREGRSRFAGIVFAGVGTGIAVAGLIGLAAGVARVTPAQTWIGMGLLASLAALCTWPAFRSTAAAGAPSAPRAPQGDDASRVLRMVLCYGAFGLGYILPATFLPALARDAVADAAVFGWVWPVFGATAAASTLVASRWLHRHRPITVWGVGQLVMASGVAVVALSSDLPALLFCAICVGGTFVVVTMAAIEHARVTSGAAAPRVIAAMTAAFAFGQLVGPLMLTADDSVSEAVRWPSLLAAAALVASAWALLIERRRTRASTIVTSQGPRR